MNPLARNGSGTAPADLRYRGGNFLIAPRTDSEAAAEVSQTKMRSWLGCFSREKANLHCGRHNVDESQPKNDANLLGRAAPMDSSTGVTACDTAHFPLISFRCRAAAAHMNSQL
ncbi:hypothetical protein ElyMa_003646400 [Elysia marginata]|uniref:Uncharacterized protein n=1 Tax=Elysia marginata TaxID=1093978 RepID=A0AAV4EVI2_9GAST|nr:hypothetical protein ElyMa_003646400 [Elysia marginata]